MPQYRIYLVDAADHITQAHDFEGPNDESAMDKANLLRETRPAEIWQSTRLVSRIDSDAETRKMAFRDGATFTATG